MSTTGWGPRRFFSALVDYVSMSNDSLPPAESASLARIVTVLASVAPEIPEAEIVADAHLETDLGLDRLSVWALANGLEKIAKVEIPDAKIQNSHTVADLIPLAISNEPLPNTERTDSGEPIDKPDTDVVTQVDTESEPTENMADALENLADFFNN